MRPRCPRIVVDCSEISRKDSLSGIQRVFVNRFRFLSENAGLEYTLQPVYATRWSRGYRLCESTETAARRYIFRRSFRRYKPVPGDIFFALDSHSYIQLAQRSFFRTLKAKGIPLVFLIHDILPYSKPEWFPGDSLRRRQHWNKYLHVVSMADAVFAVSRTTAGALLNWFTSNTQHSTPKIKIIPNGAEIQTVAYGNALSTEENALCFSLRAHTTFLMVGTLEPRKGHRTVLEAFTRIWKKSNEPLKLVIVGRIGWSVDALVKLLNDHQEKGVRLLWLENVGDNLLARLYQSCSCLIAASYGEGYGLPLAEAAVNEMPIIARDLPVFREVAGDQATYFEGDCPNNLAGIIETFAAKHATKPERTSYSYHTNWQATNRTMLRELLALVPAVPTPRKH